MNIKIPVSPGELIDKFTILEIKRSKIKDKTKLSTVKTEYAALNVLIKKYKLNTTSVNTLKRDLLSINLKLWNIEDRIRKKEALHKFDKEFISLARSVYKTNDKRSALKNKINLLFGSNITEIKQYAKY